MNPTRPSRAFLECEVGGRCRNCIEGLIAICVYSAARPVVKSKKDIIQHSIILESRSGDCIYIDLYIYIMF